MTEVDHIRYHVALYARASDVETEARATARNMRDRAIAALLATGMSRCDVAKTLGVSRTVLYKQLGLMERGRV